MVKTRTEKRSVDLNLKDTGKLSQDFSLLELWPEISLGSLGGRRALSVWESWTVIYIQYAYTHTYMSVCTYTHTHEYTSTETQAHTHSPFPLIPPTTPPPHNTSPHTPISKPNQRRPFRSARRPWNNKLTYPFLRRVQEIGTWLSMTFSLQRMNYLNSYRQNKH